MSRLAGAALLSLLTCTAAAQQLQLPTDADLRTAYCIPLLEADIAGLDSSILSAKTFLTQIQGSSARESANKSWLRDLVDVGTETLAADEKRRAQSIDTLNRLHAFLAPRMSHLDTTALHAAENRAAADLEEDNKQVTACANRCVTTSERNAAACVAKECTETQLAKRFDDCRHPTWLPF